MRNSLIDSALKTYRQVDYLCGNYNREIVESDPRLTRTIHYSNSLGGVVRLIKATLLSPYDSHIDLKDHDSSISLFIGALSRAPLKVGCNRRRFRPFDRDTSGTNQRFKHKVDIMKDIAQLAGLDVTDFRLSVPCSEASVQWFKSSGHPGGPFYFLNLSATAPARMWPVEHWIRFLNECHRQDWPVLVNGIPAHRHLVERIVGGVKRGVVFKPRNLMDVIAAMKASSAVITVDTGLAHVASALDKSLLALFGSNGEVEEFGPRALRQLVIKAESNQSLSMIDPDRAIRLTNENGILANP